MDVVSRRISLTAWGRLYGFDKATTSRLHHTGKLPPELQIEQLPNGRYYVVVPPDNDGRCVVYRPGFFRGPERKIWTGRWVGSWNRRPSRVIVRTRSSRRSATAWTGTVAVCGVWCRTIRWALIVVEHRERLSRFGFEYVEAALSGRGARILVMDEGELEDDLVRDVTEVITSLCARLYGRRSARRRAERALAAAQEG